MVSILSDSVRSFWHWFRVEEERLFHLADRPEPLFTELIGHLQKIHPGLVLELGPETDGRRELAISAGGCLEVFPAVLAVTALAPDLKRWQIIAFRQPKPDCFVLSSPEFDIDTDQVTFRAESSSDLLHLDLIYSGGSRLPDSSLEQAAFFLVDIMLGEFTMEVFIGRCTTRRGNAGEGRPLRELSAVVEAHTSRVTTGRAQRPWGLAM